MARCCASPPAGDAKRERLLVNSPRDGGKVLRARERDKPCGNRGTASRRIVAEAAHAAVNKTDGTGKLAELFLLKADGKQAFSVGKLGLEVAAPLARGVQAEDGNKATQRFDETGELLASEISGH